MGLTGTAAAAAGVRAVVVVPHPPLLLPGVGGATDPLAGLRDRCVALVRAAGAPVVLLGAPTPGVRTAASLEVGRWLCRAAGVEVAGAWAAGDRLDLPDGAVLVVVADGTAARGDKPPAGVHPGAEAVDRELERMLRDADSAGLRAFTPDPLLQCRGAPAFRALGRHAAGRSWRTSDVTHEAPYGVAYLTARWILET